MRRFLQNSKKTGSSLPFLSLNIIFMNGNSKKFKNCSIFIATDLLMNIIAFVLLWFYGWVIQILSD